MKSRLITWILLGSILFLAYVANQPKQEIVKEIRQTTIQITCPQIKPTCVRLPDTGALSTNQ